MNKLRNIEKRSGIGLIGDYFLKKSCVFLSLFLWLGLFHQSHAQHLLKSPWKSISHQYYQLSDGDMDTLLMPYSIGMPSLLLDRQPDIEVPADSIVPSIALKGNWVKVFADHDLVQHELLTYFPYKVELLEEYDQLELQVSNFDGTAIKDPMSVKLDGREIQKGKFVDTYRLPSSRKTRKLSITCNGYTRYYLLRNYQSRNPFFKNLWESRKNLVRYRFQRMRRFVERPRLRSLFGRFNFRPLRRFGGYMSFNKPLYLPGDTVRMKAMILKKNGKPIRRKNLTLTLHPKGGKAINLSYENPGRGSFTSTFVLGDSLKIDQAHRLSFSNRKAKYGLLSSSFRIEDYELRGVEYSFRRQSHGDRDRFSPFDFYARAIELNGLNALDGQIDIEYTVEQLHAAEADSLFVPTNIASESYELDSFGETKITFPDSLLPAAKLVLRAEAEIYISDESSDTMAEEWTYNGLAHSVSIKLQGKQLHCIAQDKKGALSGKATFKQIRLNQTVEESEVQLPHFIEVDPTVMTYLLEFKGERASYSLSRDLEEVLSIEGRRTADSVQLVMYNPFLIPVHYEIYNAKGKVLKKGFATELDWAKKDQSYRSYGIQYHYYLAGHLQKGEKVFAVKDKDLNLEFDGPDAIYPGQKTAITVKASDFKGEKASDVNLTLGAYNAGFENPKLQTPPYLGKKRAKRRASLSYHLEPRSLFSKGHRKDWVKKLGVDTMMYYQMIRPGENGFQYYQPIGDERAQLAPHLFFKGGNLSPMLVYVDDQLVYATGIGASIPYSFSASPGHHEVRVRTANFSVEMDSVLFKSGQKLHLSVDIGKLPPSVRVDTVGRDLTAQELTAIHAATLRIRAADQAIRGYLVQDDHYYPISNLSQGRTGIFFPVKEDSLSLILVDEERELGLLHSAESDVWIEAGKSDTLKRKENKKVRNRSTYTLKKVIGDLLPGKEVMPEPRPKQLKKNRSSKSRQVGNSTLLIEYAGDSLVQKYTLYSMADTSIQRRLQSFHGELKGHARLPAGWYQVKLETYRRSVAYSDSLYVPKGGFQFYRIKPLDFEVDTTILEMHGSTSPRGTEGGTLEGYITDAASKEAVPSANVVLKAPNQKLIGAQTDFDGYYQINGIPSGYYQFEVNFIGYNSHVEQVFIDPNTRWSIDVALNEGNLQLDEVVVTAYSMSATASSISVVGSRTESLDLSSSTAGLLEVPCWDKDEDGLMDPEEDTNEDGQWDERDCPDSLLSKMEQFPRSEQVGIRSDFRDYGFWVPDLQTDKNGEASFEVQFPDNLTKWNCFAIAVDKKRRTGFAGYNVPAVMQLSARLSTPRFFRTGDSITLVGKSVSYTQEQQEIQTQFKVDGQIVKEGTSQLLDALVDQYQYVAAEQDTVSLTYSMSFDDFEDGEERKVPIYPVGTEEHSGTFGVLEAGEKLNIDIDPQMGPVQLHVETDMLPTIRRSLRGLQNYRHLCTEQAASRLMAYLVDQKICTFTGQKFKHKRVVRKLIKRLEATQNKDRTWGWWPGGRFHSWMSGYAMGVLKQADDMGYKVSIKEETLSHLQWKVGDLSGRHLLDALEILSLYDQELPYKKYLSLFDQQELESDLDRLRILEIKRQQGIPYQLGEILELKKETILGNAYWGKQYSYWYSDDILATCLAAKLIEAKDAAHETLQQIRRYVLSQYSISGWRNTLQTAAATDLLSDYYLKTGGRKSRQPAQSLQLTIDGVPRELNDFPIELQLEAQTMELSYSRGLSPLYCSGTQSHWNKNPEAVANDFKIETSFMNDSTTLTRIDKRDRIRLKVKLTLDKSIEYGMLEIPIPAGCSYAKESRGWSRYGYEQQFRDRKLIYLQKLSAGEHHFYVDLDARYAGSYQVNPAKFELMYFPTLFARTGMSQVKILEP